MDKLIAELAAKVRDLRKPRMTQAELGKQMTMLGTPWSRTTVHKLESGHRETVTVQELIGLAIVFDMPPALLLADPDRDDTVHLADGYDVEAATAFAWLIGAKSLAEHPSEAWQRAAKSMPRFIPRADFAATLEGLERVVRLLADVQVRMTELAAEKGGQEFVDALIEKFNLPDVLRETFRARVEGGSGQEFSDAVIVASDLPAIRAQVEG